MIFNKEQASLIWTLFLLQNSERKISEFTQLGSNRKKLDLTLNQLILIPDDEYTWLQNINDGRQYVFCSAPVGSNQVRFSVWDFNNNIRKDFNPLDYISFEDKV